MSGGTTSSQHNAAPLILKLCSHIYNKQSNESLSSTYRFVLRALSTAPLPQNYDEFVITEKIKKKLVKQGRQKDALAFADLARKLQNCTILKNRSGILMLFLNLVDTDRQYDKYAHFTSELLRIATLSPEITLHANDIIVTKPVTSVLRAAGEGYAENQRFPKVDNEKGFAEGKNHVSHVAAMFSKKVETEKSQFVSPPSVKNVKEPPAVAPKPYVSEERRVSVLIQKNLLRDILYAVQGISGKNITWLHYETGEGSEKNKVYNADVAMDLPFSTRKLVFRFTELGWMYLKVRDYCTNVGLQTSQGLIMQSFIAGLQQNLTEYYRVLAILQAQLQDDIRCSRSNANMPLTIHRLSVWFYDPFLHFKVLASIVDTVKGMKGGELASVLFSYLQHGDQMVQQLVKRLLTKVTQPLYKMISNWIFCGELEDTFSEFFITASLSVPNNRMWQEKYSLRKSMLPSFINMDQAKKILSTGKAINFLRQVCQDHTFVQDNEKAKKFYDSKNAESLFTQENDGEFQITLDKNYRKTSTLALCVLHNEYKLMEHFQAMRHYFLLGQGDFIRHLMDLLESELGKPANMLYIHNLSGILESAIRATNAQYHDPDILQRLDVRLLEASVTDTGWDVFSLDYHVDGPIGTVFTPDCMRSYLRIFNSLWKSKHMEYILSNISQARTTYLKTQKQIPCVAPITYQCHLILSQMVHFVQQIQYYLAFEVMECCWADLLHKVESAQDLDEIIMAHEKFLDMLLTRSLLNDESRALRNQLNTVYECIVMFQNIQEKFWPKANSLVLMHNQQEEHIRVKTKAGAWGMTEKQTHEYEIQLVLLKELILNVKAELKILKYSYEDMVQKFLVMLNDSDDPNLRFLSFRLDFNEHFKNRNTLLHSSLTYLHRRRSLRYM